MTSLLASQIGMELQCSLASMASLMNQGRPRPMQMSKTLEPTALDTAMSPSPSSATEMEPSASGMDVPMARKVRPMTTSGMPQRQPILSMNSTMKYEIHVMWMSEMKKVAQNHFCPHDSDSDASAIICFLSSLFAASYLSSQPSCWVGSSSSSRWQSGMVIMKMNS